MPKETIHLVFSETDNQDYRNAWAKMPYGASIHVDYTITPLAIIGNLDRLRKSLTVIAATNAAQAEELTRLRKMVSSFGALMRLANELSAPEQVGGPR